MPPVSRLDMWANMASCSVVTVDCLMPNGVLIPIEVRIEATLTEIKTKLWRESISFPLSNLLRDMGSYVFVCVNLQGKIEELVDENRQLVDAKPFRPMLKLIERKGDREEKLLSSKIGVLIGKPLDEYEHMQNAEIDEFRRRYGEFVEGIARERRQLEWEARAMYAYPPHVDFNESAPHFVERNLMENRRFLVNVAIRNNRASMKDMHAFNVSADAYPQELLLLVLRKRGAIMGGGGHHDTDNLKDFVLKVKGRECYLLGDYALLQYQYIRDCVARCERPELCLVNRDSLEVTDISVTGKQSVDPVTRPPPPLPPREDSLSLWSINTNLKVKLVSAFNVNTGESMKVTVRAGIYHGNEVLCGINNTKHCNGPSPVWNEFLNFDILVSNIPRMARLCLVLYGVYNTKKRRRREESIPLAWVNTTLFDFRGQLRQGPLTLVTWPVTETMAEQLNPIGTVVSNINTNTSPVLLIEFQRYANTVVYPPYEKIVELAADHTQGDIFKSFSESELERLRQIIDREPLAPIFEQDKEFVWLLRIECRENYPHALGKLLSCMKWNCKEDVAQMQVLLQIWKPLDPEQALEILDCNYADQKVREFAVRCLEEMNDDDLGQYLLQLVQVLKFESYLDCDLAMFILKRTLNNQVLGHSLFWLLRAEMHNPEVSVRFGLMLEAYLRGAPDHIKSLQKQDQMLIAESELIDGFLVVSLSNRHSSPWLVIVHALSEQTAWGIEGKLTCSHYSDSRSSVPARRENYRRTILLKHTGSILVEALNKLKTISCLLYNVESSKKEKGLQTMKECLQQKTYQDALSKLTSPLDPTYKLKKLRVEECKFMDSKMKPLWLDFENHDELAAPVKIIFKSGDDLRQDMLTLQLIRIMDRLWKQEGLDLDMIPYGCLSTGFNIGMIQVVDNAETVAKIQTRQEGAISGAFAKSCILDWLSTKHQGKDLNEAIRRFTMSCAGYCVATYVLGVGDRHSDNIMVSKTGQLFHIDFGHFLGNFKIKFGIRRERVPFVLTDHFVHVITRGRTDRKPEDTEEFQYFRSICEKAFLILRQKGSLLINLFVMMLSAGIPELRTANDISYLRKTLNLEVSEDEAVKQFNKRLKEALDNSWKTSINWAVHNKVRNN